MHGIQRFGFYVTRGANDDGEPNDTWKVQLPHQCDGWTISADDAYARNPPHDVAVARLEAFIAEANLALGALKRRDEVDLGY